MPVKSRPIASEELQHVFDKNLDAAFEARLLRADDDLMPISKGEDILIRLFGEMTVPDDSNETVAREIKAGSNRAFDIATSLGAEPDEPMEMPVLPDNPTESDLRKYAENHPAIRNITKLFRGRVVGVRKK